VAFDVATGELLLGGAPPEFGLAPRKAGSWRPGAEPVESGLAAHGPVTCRSDDTRLQFVHAGGLDFLLRDITRGSVQPPLSIDCDDPSIQEPVRNELGLPVLALSADGAVVAAAVQRPDGPDHASDTGAVAVWDAGTGQLLCSLPVHATALALAGDGRRLATGDRHGRVGVWALPEGSLQAELPQGHELVQSLAFGPDPPRRAAGDGPWCDVRLAVGCASGRVAIWEVGEHRMAVTCRGMSHRVLALRFNGDGTILAAAGLNVMLWDSVTGDLQLTIPGTYGTALAFSADDRMLAVSDYASFERPGQVQLWSLEADRGIRTLRGLDTEVAIVAFSDDGRLLAGLSGDWFIAVWDCRTGAMRLALEAPRGFSSDNAGLAFSRDGRRLACLAGTEARLWDLASGERLCTWPLPAGLTDTLAFDDRGDLVAARCEPATFSGLPPSREQAVCRVRRLTLDGAVHVISEHPEFSTKVIGMALDPLGNWLAIEGKCATPARQEQRIKLVDVATGAELRPPVILSKDQDVSRFRVDPKGGLLAFDPANEAGRALMAMPSGEIVVPMSRAESLGPGAATHFEQFSGGGSAVFLRGEERPAIVLRDAQAALRITVDMAGTQAAWGTRDGTVMLADLARLLRSREDLGGTP
jgi:WD40 repeat protein